MRDPPHSNYGPLLISRLAKSNPSVLVIENSVELAHKHVSQNPLGSSWNVHSHHGEQASSTGLNHKSFSWDGPRLTIDGKIKIWDISHLVAIDGVLSHNVGLGAN